MSALLKMKTIYVEIKLLCTFWWWSYVTIICKCLIRSGKRYLLIYAILAWLFSRIIVNWPFPLSIESRKRWNSSVHVTLLKKDSVSVMLVRVPEIDYLCFPQSTTVSFISVITLDTDHQLWKSLTGWSQNIHENQSVYPGR